MMTRTKLLKTSLKSLSFFVFLCLLLMTFTAAKKPAKKLLPLTSIHIVDRNGFEETISNKERLKQYQKVDFLQTQSYQKVLRIYARNSKGNVRSVVTTYHENGNPKQFLEILNARANGAYQEWHENGEVSLSTRVIGGSPDVTPLSEKTWIFDGPSTAWDEDGNLVAEMTYNQGVLEGTSKYYHSSGKLWKRVPYTKNQVDGIVETYKEDGSLLQQVTYCCGAKNGTATRYWDLEHLASQEEYSQDRLENGQYFNSQGELISEVKQGCGLRAIFSKDRVRELQEYQDGILEGKVQVFSSNGCLKRIYHIKNNVKHGEEIEYFERTFAKPTDQPQSKLSFYWYEGKIQGHCRSWYPSGNQESQKEMANNAKNGVSTAWYRDGNLMMIEEYEENKLIRGDYFRKGEKTPISQVMQGKGLVSIFDADGHFVQKIIYANGKPDS
jgi:antitoxin component YwqK of YwqJK toxin-antitoxin module